MPDGLRDRLAAAYDLLGELGHGGFAIVYLARERASGRSVAVKVMRPELMVAPDLVERFRREIAFASRLDHPNVMPVLFSGEDNDLVYYAMPRLKGKTLAKHLEAGEPLGRRETVRILREVGEGLAYAHGQGVIHRDVKPSNVMIEPDGHAVILDFGIAKALASKGNTLSISGQLVGSPAYMSPEQAEGAKDLNEQTDIYSWGVMGYHMLVGEPPFTGDSVPDVLHKHRSVQPPSLLQKRPDAPGELVAVLGRALAKDRRVRWRRMREALDALPASIA